MLLQVNINQLYAGDILPSEEEAEYPATPEGVVGSEHKQQYEYKFLKKSSYFLKEAKCEADCGIIVKSFTVKTISQSKDKAKVMIKFDVIGTFNSGYISEKKDNGNTLTKTKLGECNEFDIFNTTDSNFDYGVIYYDLVRKKDKWKIVHKSEGCTVTYISIDAAIKLIQDNMISVKDDNIKQRNLKIIDLLRIKQKNNK